VCGHRYDTPFLVDGLFERQAAGVGFIIDVAKGDEWGMGGNGGGGIQAWAC
jgi:hypothetical protein